MRDIRTSPFSLTFSSQLDLFSPSEKRFPPGAGRGLLSLLSLLRARKSSLISPSPFPFPAGGRERHDTLRSWQRALSLSPSSSFSSSSPSLATPFSKEEEEEKEEVLGEGEKFSTLLHSLLPPSSSSSSSSSRAFSFPLPPPLLSRDRFYRIFSEKKRERKDSFLVVEEDSLAFLL